TVPANVDKTGLCGFGLAVDDSAVTSDLGAGDDAAFTSGFCAASSCLTLASNSRIRLVASFPLNDSSSVSCLGSPVPDSGVSFTGSAVCSGAAAGADSCAFG